MRNCEAIKREEPKQTETTTICHKDSNPSYTMRILQQRHDTGITVSVHHLLMALYSIAMQRANRPI
jgi:hypothetical protein